MIPDSVRNPQDHWTPIATRAKADALAYRYNQDDDGPGLYEVHEKGTSFAIAYYDEDGAFCGYV